jgi:hypothetical protein
LLKDVAQVLIDVVSPEKWKRSYNLDEQDKKGKVRCHRWKSSVTLTATAGEEWDGQVDRAMPEWRCRRTSSGAYLAEKWRSHHMANAELRLMSNFQASSGR